MTWRAIFHEFNADRASAGQSNTARLRPGDDREIGPVHRRPQKSARRVPAHTAPLIDPEIATAFVVAAIEIVDLGNTDLGGRIAKRIEDLPRQPHFLDAPFAALAVEFIGAGDVVFRALEIGQHIVPRPARIAELPPAVVVARLAAHVDYAVDRRAATENAPARIIERTAVQTGLVLRLEAPIGARIVLCVEIADGNADPDVIVVAAGFQQQHRYIGIGRQTIGQDAAGAASTNDDVIEASECLVHDAPADRSCHTEASAATAGRTVPWDTSNPAP